jgi:DnaJ homolog subfamily C member 28
MSHIRQLRIVLPSSRRKYQSASQKLFADAEKEEHDERQRDLKERLEQRLIQEQNWTGDEKMEDTVLRMLVDKYKPLRGSMQTSEMKLKANPPQITMRTPESQPSTSMQAEDVILPGIEGHKPWMTTYTTPSFAVNPSIRAMRLPLQAANKRSTVDDTVKVKGPTREERLRVAEANRLASARERILDYRFGGFQNANIQPSSEGAKANPKTMKGWASLAEERIHVRYGSLQRTAQRLTTMPRTHA